MSKTPDLCEGCGEIKPVVLISRKAYNRQIIHFVLLVLSIGSAVGLLAYLGKNALDKRRAVDYAK